MIKKKVMVIDDDEKAVVDIASMLEKEGYTTAAFTSASAALQTLEAVGDVDLILTDIHIPGLDGTQVLKYALEMKRPVPVIVFTGYGEPGQATSSVSPSAEKNSPSG
ncbi:MAG: response regulator [Deltaproteobacteria bacterium]|nr:response regulator [Deltaproteobacteria bacterium]